MKRAGFTMIELIFVIVILGILSAVAVPKMMGVSDKADAGVCKSYYSSLNGTVSPTLWSNMAMDGEDAATAYAEDKIEEQIDTPANGKCGTIAEISDAATDGTSYTVTISDTTYDVNATQATKSTPAAWKWSKE
jgi:prepilin-type N-terminal cleavage/methylation domain-containing protein